MQFNYYGLIIGLAVLCAWQVTESFSKKFKVWPKVFNQATIWFGLGALVGARLWHVITTPDLYIARPELIIRIQNGGMSIWGAIWGGVASLIVVICFGCFWRRKDTKKNQIEKKQFLLLLDSLSLGLPIAQAIGRLGNWFNQELYGLPSNLPWAITIDRVNRLPGFEEIDRYHPLFAYEIIGLIILWALIWRLPDQSPPGRRFAFYLSGYTFLRFGLDFIRLDQMMLNFFPLSVNQLVSVVLLILFYFFTHLMRKDNTDSTQTK